LTEERGEEHRIHTSVERRLEVPSTPVVFGAQVDVVKRVHVDPHHLAPREHLAHHPYQAFQPPREGLEVLLRDRVVETFLDNVPVEHVQVIPGSPAEGDVVRFGDIGEERVPQVGDSGFVIVWTAGEAFF
jgi:hypothetical protein